MKLNKEQLTSILDQIDDFNDAEDAAAGFTRGFSKHMVREAEGSLELHCLNSQTAEWVQQQVISLQGLPTLQVQVGPYTGKLVRYSVRVGNREISERRFFSRFVSENPGLDISSWKIVTTFPIRNTMDMIVVVSMMEASAQQLTEVFGRRLRFGVRGLVEFKDEEERKAKMPGSRTLGYRKLN